MIRIWTKDTFAIGDERNEVPTTSFAEHHSYEHHLCEQLVVGTASVSHMLCILIIAIHRENFSFKPRL